MSSVWLTIPSARPASEAQQCINLWHARGYRTAIWRDYEAEPVECDVLISGHYEGYAKAVNKLVGSVLEGDSECMWCVAGGDDTTPDQSHHPDEIARELIAHFGGTFGVMQPTGDRWCDGSIDRIAGSPWMGREFCERIYNGNGPFWPDFQHMHGDEHMLNVADKLGIYLRRPDLTHMHHHFLRTDGPSDVNWAATVPDHLVRWNTREHWNESHAIFNRLRAGGFAEALQLKNV